MKTTSQKNNSGAREQIRNIEQNNTDTTPRETLPPLDFTQRQANRALSTDAVLALIQQKAPAFHGLAEVIGRWVWITFTGKQPREVTRQLAELGFHWNNNRQAWQRHLKNFGHAGEVTVVAPGINGKMSEFNAALGLLQLKHIDQMLAKRLVIDATYRQHLKSVAGIRCLNDSGEKVANYAFFPILVGEDYPIARDELYLRLKARGIHPRRYFYPLISEFPMYRGLPSAHRDNLPRATAAARQVLCLPIYPDLEMSVVEDICQFIAEQ